MGVVSGRSCYVRPRKPTPVREMSPIVLSFDPNDILVVRRNDEPLVSEPMEVAANQTGIITPLIKARALQK